MQSQIEKMYIQQEREAGQGSSNSKATGATPMGDDLTTEEKIKQQSQLEQDEFQFLCDMFLESGIGDLITPEEIRRYLRDEGFD